MTEPDDQQQDVLKREALAWLSRVSLGEATREDLAELRRWRDTSPAHAEALARAGQLWRELETPVAALARTGAMSASTGRSTAFRPGRRAFLAGGAAMAAAAAGVMIVRPPLDLWPALAELAADHRTGVGEQQHLNLADAVSVDLNTRTSISMRPADQGAGIELISGETSIAIDRAAAQPFTVVAADGRMTASRATFNVRRLGPTVDLTCIDGEVSVECGGRALRLGTGQQVAYDAAGLGKVTGADTSVVTAWREGMLVFRNTPLVDVIEEVNRYRSGRIVLMDAKLGQRLVTARFEIKRLDTVMGQIGNVFKVPVKSFPGGLVLVG
jgi:transmembrane sensor